MYRFFVFASLLLMVACGTKNAPLTPRAAAEQTCDLLMAGDYDTVLDHLQEMQAAACGQTLTAEYAERMATEAIKEMMKGYIRTIFENPNNPITGYEVVKEDFAPDSTRAMVVVRFKTQIDTLNLTHTFSMRKKEDGSWHSVQ